MLVSAKRKGLVMVATRIRSNVPLVLGGAVALLLILAMPANSDPGEKRVIVPASGSHQAPSEAEQGDLEVIAKSQGVSVENANIRYGWQEKFTKALSEVAARYPDQFAEGVMAPEPGVDARVSFSGNVPTEARRYFTNLPVPVELVGGAKASARKNQSDVSDVARLARQVFDSPLGVEIIDEVIVVSVEGAPQKAESSSGLTDLQEILARSNVSISYPLQIRWIDDLGGEAQVVVYGGGPLSTCTSGFTVRRTSGTQLGIITADHCSDSQQYDGFNVLTYRSRLATSQGDMQYMSSSDSVGYSFYNDRGRLSSQDAVSTPSTNMAICVFGKSTNVKKCTTVRSTSPVCVDERTNYRGYCNLISANANVTGSGDSGGPWSYGTTVYGITHGIWLNRSVFTPLYNTLSQLGITIRY